MSNSPDENTGAPGIIDAGRPIVTLRDRLWYLRSHESRIPVANDGQIVSLGSLNPEEWATKVAGYLNNNELPGRLRGEDEEEQGVAQQVDGIAAGYEGGLDARHVRRRSTDLRNPPDVSGSC